MSLLPAEFADLEPFAAKWCVDTEDERFAVRMASSMEEIQAFYDAFEPRAETAVAHCDRYTLDDLPEDGANLLRLLCALVQASFPVECWRQVKVPDTGAAAVDCIVQPAL